MKWLFRLYPRAWRDRYRDELSALVEGRRPSRHDLIDLVRGIADAWRHPHLPDGIGDGRGRVGVNPRATSQVAGVALVLSPVALVALLLGMILSRHGADELLPFRIWKTLTYTVVPTLVLLGLAGLWLRAAQHGQLHLAGKVVFSSTVLGWLAIEVGVVVWATAPLGQFPTAMRDVLIAGFILFLVSYGFTGLVAAQERLLPRWSALPPIAALLAGATVLAFLAGHGSGLVPDWGTGTAIAFFLALLILSWVGLGLALLTDAHDEPAARTPSPV